MEASREPKERLHQHPNCEDAVSLDHKCDLFPLCAIRHALKLILSVDDCLISPLKKQEESLNEIFLRSIKLEIETVNPINNYNLSD